MTVELTEGYTVDGTVPDDPVFSFFVFFSLFLANGNLPSFGFQLHFPVFAKPDKLLDIDMSLLYFSSYIVLKFFETFLKIQFFNY